MLLGQLLGRFLIPAAVLAVWALAALAPDAARADAAQVTVIAAGGSQQTLSLEALGGSEDVVDRTYLLRSGSGESSQTVSGFSLAALVEAAGVDPYAFSYLEVLRPTGGAVQLSRHQALDPGAFAEGSPVVYATAAGTGFLRPNGGADDLNASDSFEAPQGVTIALRKGSPLKVQAEASTLKTRPGKAVKFSAEAEGAGAGETLTYSWYFDDGASAAGANASHAFSRRGSYDVVIGVTTPGDSTGSSAVVTVQVGPPLSGPDRKGGGTRRDREAPDHGAATGTDGTAGGGSSSAATAGAAPTPEPARSEEKPQEKPIETTTQPPADAPISGRLLSAPAAATPEPDRQPAARAGNPSDGDSDGLSLSGAALGLIITGGLLGLGAFSEARSLLP
ncbi:MAG TPA: PKD domain-containing protein [Solirubrobacterales bacterium]